MGDVILLKPQDPDTTPTTITSYASTGPSSLYHPEVRRYTSPTGERLRYTIKMRCARGAVALGT